MVFDKIDINGDGKEVSHATSSSALSFSFPAARFAGVILGVGCPVAVGEGKVWLPLLFHRSLWAPGGHCSVGLCCRGAGLCAMVQPQLLDWCGGCGWRMRAAGYTET